MTNNLTIFIVKKIFTGKSCMFTVKAINSYAPRKNSYYEWDKTGERGKGRLGIQILPSGSKVFRFRYFQNSKEQFVTIGFFPGVTLSRARDLAKEYGEMLSQRLYPKEVLKAREEAKARKEIEESRSGTFEQLIYAHAEFKKREGNRCYADELKKIEDHVFPYVDTQKKAKEFEADDFLVALGLPIKEGHEPTSNKLRSILHSAFNFALHHENNPAKILESSAIDLDVKFGLKNNPIASIPRQKSGDRVGTHYMTWEEVAQLIHDMDHRYHDLNLASQTRQVLKLCFYLGGQRPHEIVTLRWYDVNFDNKTVVIREANQKSNKVHVVPLTDSALAILQEVKESATETSPFVFYKKTNSTEHMPTNTIAQAIGTYKSKTDVTPFVARDFRRTVKTLGGEIKISKEYRDRMQGHAINDVSGKHYDMYEYLDEKREALETWEKALNERVEQLKERLQSEV